MKDFEAGDVVIMYYVFKDLPDTKLRPAVIIEDCGNEYFVCQITSKDRGDTTKGFWVLKDSPEGNQMGIRSDSFVNAENTEYVKPNMIQRKIGTFPYIDKLSDLTAGL